jgi:hypothetical protein
MKKLVRRLTDEDLKDYPIANVVEGWFFQVKEVSNGVYRVQGTDRWTHTVTRTGEDPEALLLECKKDIEGMFSR